MVRADTFWSQALGTRKQVVVYLPPSYGSQPARRYPVAYYLHGLGGDEWNWSKSGHLNESMDSLVAAGAPEMILVMPDGDDSWYTTWNVLLTQAVCERDTTRREPAASYCVPWQHYDDYIARDLVARIDSTYRTMPDRRHRGIAGLSMGGLGAVSLALAYPDVFSAGASHSGVVAPLYVGPHPYQAPAQFAGSVEQLRGAAGSLWKTIRPAFGPDTASWMARDPSRLAARAKARASRGGPPVPSLFIDCGVADRLVDQNRSLDAALKELGIAHQYAEWPGGHTWQYWRAHGAQSLAWMGERLR